MASIRLEKIAFQAGAVSILTDINLNIPDGQFWVFVGPSGCGKSTLLRIIAGLEQATSGSVYIEDQKVNQVSARERDVAMVFQNYALYPHMTVAENLAFGLKMRQVDHLTIQQRIEETARSLNIHHLLSRKPKQLSGGQQQRVALGRAIIRQPKVFLLDEPLSNLDAQLRDETRAELKQLHTRLGITTIYVTHDQVEAMTLADQIVILDRGKIQQQGTPQEVYANPKNYMVASFLGSPPMNIFPVTYQDHCLQVGEQSLLVSPKIWNNLQPEKGQQFKIGIRPECLTIAGHYSSEKNTENINNFAELSLIVDLVEPLGRETLVRAILPETDILINVYAPPTWKGKSGDHLTIQLNLDQLFLFDINTGLTL